MDHWADYLIFALFLCVSLGIGLYHALTGGRQRTVEEFVMADRKLKVLPTAISMLVTNQSALMILGFSAEMYIGGIQAWIVSLLSYVIAVLCVERLIIPLLYPMRITSVYKMFEERFGTKDVRLFAAILGIINKIMYISMCVLAPSVALEIAAGFPLKASIPTMTIVCIVYTSLGGMKAVIWSDLFQFIIMLGGMLAVLIKAFVEVDGLENGFRLISREGRLVWADWSFDPTVRHTVWGFLIGWTTMWIGIYGFSQEQVQRYCALKTMKEAKLAMLLNLPAVCIMVSIAYLSGMGVVAYYSKQGCDPVADGTIKGANQLVPLFVKQLFTNTPGFSGVFLATLYSGALSSVSSSLSGVAANIWEDILCRILPPMSDYKASLINKALVCVCGLSSIAIAFIAATMPGTLVQVSISISSAAGSPLLGMFAVSSVRAFTWLHSKAVLCGGIAGFIFNFSLACGSSLMKVSHPSLPPLNMANCTLGVNITQSLGVNITQSLVPSVVTYHGIKRFFNISYLWYSPFGAMVTILTALVTSPIMNIVCKKKAEVDVSTESLGKIKRKNSCDIPLRITDMVKTSAEPSTENPDSVQLLEYK